MCRSALLSPGPHISVYTCVMCPNDVDKREEFVRGGFAYLVPFALFH